jgi:hypothetical protein
MAHLLAPVNVKRALRRDARGNRAGVVVPSGPAWNLRAYSVRRAGVSCSGSIEWISVGPGGVGAELVSILPARLVSGQMKAVVKMKFKGTAARRPLRGSDTATVLADQHDRRTW